MNRGIAALLVLLVAFPVHALDNQLKQHPSPYLALHGSDPTAWQEWNPQTIERARRENKLLFVSIGYFSCHWCHVMQRESYKNADIAKLLNERYIPVKVDRELNGALDAELQAFAGVAWTGEKSSAFYGLTYLAPEFDSQPQGQVIGSVNLNFRF